MNQALGLDFKRWPSDATLLTLFNKAHLQEFEDLSNQRGLRKPRA